MIRALFGGTFDPFHSGHLALAEHLLRTGLADTVVVMPAGRHPWRDPPLAAGEHRLAMARVALAETAGAGVDPREVERPGPSYTVETLGELVAEHPEDRWRVVVGADNAADFARWRRPRRLLELAEVLVVARAGWRGELPAELAAGATRVTDFAHPARASDIRAALAAGTWPRADLPPAVAAYIRTHGLYGVGPPDGGREGI